MDAAAGSPAHVLVEGQSGAGNSRCPAVPASNFVSNTVFLMTEAGLTVRHPLGSVEEGLEL
jgi:hypothetical protein